MKIALIGCTKDKKKWIHRAFDLYSKSVLFRKYLLWCKQNKIDDFYILSAKYWLLDKNKIISYYNYTLIGKKKEIRKERGKMVSEQIKKNIPKNADIYIIASKIYYEFLDIPNNKIYPFEGIHIFKRMHDLKI